MIQELLQNETIKDKKIDSLTEEIKRLEIEKKKVEDKLSKIRTKITEVKNKFEAEIMKRETKASQIKEYYEKKMNEQQIILKEKELTVQNYKEAFSKMKIERIQLENIVFSQEEKINDLTNEVSRLEKIIIAKNEQMKQNEVYSLEIIKIINELKKKVNTKGEKEMINLNKKITNLNSELENNKKLVESLEQKNKILQGNYIKLSTSLKNNMPQHLNQSFKISAYLNKSNDSLGYKFSKISKSRSQIPLPFQRNQESYQNMKKVLNQKRYIRNTVPEKFLNQSHNNETDEYLLSEAALPRILPTSRSVNENPFKFSYLAQRNEHVSNITEINQMMSEVIAQCRDNF